MIMKLFTIFSFFCFGAAVMATKKNVLVGFILGLIAFVIAMMNFLFHSSHSTKQLQFYNLNSIIHISDHKQQSPVQHARNSNIHLTTFSQFYSIDTLSTPDLKEFKSKSSKEFTTTKSPLKTILMWNAWNLRMADDPLVKAHCPVSSCLFTTDMSLIQQSDVVVLHFDTLEDFPLNRRPNQRFVFYHFESPENTASALMNDPRFRYDYFNWTMTYRRDSDIFLRDYYGSLITRTSIADNNSSARYNYNNVSYLKKLHGEQSEKASAVVETRHSNNNQTELSEIIRRKTKMVTWFVGHCSTSIRREEYVRQLSQYVSVDIFGNCTKPCPYQCDEMLRTDYKFYLAFENSWCPDYVTEKFIRPYVYEAVPVFLGGADYSQFAPPDSYIDARDFDSPKELAEYLILLNKSDSLYARYFLWKKDYYVSVPDMYGWCELCRMSHDISLPVKVYADIKQWWMFGAGECQLNSTNFF